MGWLTMFFPCSTNFNFPFFSVDTQKKVILTKISPENGQILPLNGKIFLMWKFLEKLKPSDPIWSSGTEKPLWRGGGGSVLVYTTENEAVMTVSDTTWSRASTMALHQAVSSTAGPCPETGLSCAGCLLRRAVPCRLQADHHHSRPWI